MLIHCQSLTHVVENKKVDDDMRVTGAVTPAAPDREWREKMVPGPRGCSVPGHFAVQSHLPELRY